MWIEKGLTLERAKAEMIKIKRFLIKCSNK